MSTAVTPRDFDGEREAATRAILESKAHIRVVVAGPGTGKTTAFKRAFAKAGNAGVAMTFINALKEDLRAKLPNSVRVTTFHGFCYGLLRESGGKAELYWNLLELVNDDLRRLRERAPGPRAIELAFHDLDDSDKLIGDALARMDDYGAVTFVDVVYRTLKRFQDHPDQIPAYPLVVVDEYQDFSLLETSFIAELERRSPLLVAGDDDQSLYSFKRASPAHLRQLVGQPGVAQFGLPFCSRCPAVIVEAVKDVIAEAERRGYLQGRIAKTFECFMPAKQADSDAHPTIIHARLSSHDQAGNQMGQYVVDAIAKIPVADIRESHQIGEEYPTVLVLGPPPFVDHVIVAVKAAHPQTQDKRSERRKLDPLDGYRYLALDPDSKLGWRIILRAFYNMAADDAFGAALKAKEDFRTTIPDGYRQAHTRLAGLVRRMLDQAPLTAEEENELAKQLSRPFVRIRDRIAPTIPIEDEDLEIDPDQLSDEVPADKPTIVCASPIGAKGLSGGYVFFVGCLDNYASTPNGMTDDDICKFIVALSRTRKALHLVSSDIYYGWPAAPAPLIRWIDAGRIEERLLP